MHKNIIFTGFRITQYFQCFQVQMAEMMQKKGGFFIGGRFSITSGPSCSLLTMSLKLLITKYGIYANIFAEKHVSSSHSISKKKKKYL